MQKRDRQVSTATIVVPCSSRKTVSPATQGRAVSLPRLEQSELETAWRQRLVRLEAACTARTLYSGRGAYLGRAAAELSGAHLYFVSAGLGFVPADRRIPSYGITVADRGSDAVSCLTRGSFDPAAWWGSVCEGPYSSPFADVFTRRGRCLVALTQPYAVMMTNVLGALPTEEVARLRIFGWRLGGVLPAALHRCLMPYDQRLDAVLPGTQTDFAHRALFHFVREIASRRDGDAEGDRSCVECLLAPLSAPARPIRPRVSDGEILRWIVANPGHGVQQSLRRIRHDGIACEQSRFSRLFRQSRGEAVA